jgi:hypothetical protein
MNFYVQTVFSETMMIQFYIFLYNWSLIDGFTMSDLFKFIADPFVTNLTICVNVQIGKSEVPIGTLLIGQNLFQKLIVVHDLFKGYQWMVFKQFVNKTKLCVERLEKKFRKRRDVTDKWRQEVMDQRIENKIQSM